MAKRGRTDGRVPGAGATGAGSGGRYGTRSRAESLERTAGGTARDRREEPSRRPVAWWPFWGAFLLIAAAAGVAIGHGEMQMRNLRASVDTLHNEMSALTTNLDARDDRLSEFVSEAELRLASTVEAFVSDRGREAFTPSDGVNGAGGGNGNRGGAGTGSGANTLSVPVLASGGPANPGVYVRVRPGDSLWEISRALWGRGSLYPTLAQANELDPAEPLPVDALLRVPPVDR